MEKGKGGSSHSLSHQSALLICDYLCSWWGREDAGREKEAVGIATQWMSIFSKLLALLGGCGVRGWSWDWGGGQTRDRWEGSGLGRREAGKENSGANSALVGSLCPVLCTSPSQGYYLHKDLWNYLHCLLCSPKQHFPWISRQDVS